MYKEQRLAEILEILAEKKQLSAKDMVKHFQVSKDTIRRDFSILSERKLVQRTHGGIIPLDTSRLQVSAAALVPVLDFPVLGSDMQSLPLRFLRKAFLPLGPLSLLPE